MDTTPIKSDSKFDRAREILLTRYVPAINEAIIAEDIGLKTIDPEDLVILTREAMSVIAQRDKMHPDVEDAIAEAEQGLRIKLNFVPSRQNVFVYNEGGRKRRVFDGGNQHITNLNNGIDHRTSMSFIPVACHEVGHYSTQTRIYGDDSGLANIVRRMDFPLLIDLSPYGEKFSQLLWERTQYAIKSTELEINVDGAAMVVKGKSRDGGVYYFGLLGYNFEERLAEWFTERLRRKAINRFLDKNRDISASGMREQLNDQKTTTEDTSVRTYTTDMARRELHAIGLKDFMSAVRGYVTSMIPQLYAEKNPSSFAYF